VVKILSVLLTPAAFVWTRRADLIELGGAGCLVVAASLWSPAAAWAVAGVALLAKSATIGRP
jgi:hypothetical protein